MSIRPEPSFPVTLSAHGSAVDLLKLLDFPCCGAVLASARRTEQGYVLTGSWADFDSLAGWVAGEANHARSRLRADEADLLDRIADQLEDALASRGW
jgi:hypothetical protein